MIDWTKPLELIDGTPVKLEPHDPTTGLRTNGPNGEPDSDGDYWIVNEDGSPIDGGSYCLHPDGRDCDYGPVRVRNREQPA